MGALLVYDVTDRNSFNHVPMWLKEVEENAEKDCLIMLVGNKVRCCVTQVNQPSMFADDNNSNAVIYRQMDLHEQRTVFVRDGRSFARKNGLAFIETSALDATGVDTAFQRILQEIYKTQTKKQLKSQGGGGGKDGGAGGGGGATPAKGQTISLSAPQDQGGDGAPARKQGCCAGGQ